MRYYYLTFYRASCNDLHVSMLEFDSIELINKLVEDDFNDLVKNGNERKS